MKLRSWLFRSWVHIPFEVCELRCEHPAPPSHSLARFLVADVEISVVCLKLANLSQVLGIASEHF